MTDLAKQMAIQLADEFEKLSNPLRYAGILPIIQTPEDWKLIDEVGRKLVPIMNELSHQRMRVAIVAGLTVINGMCAEMADAIRDQLAKEESRGTIQ